MAKSQRSSCATAGTRVLAAFALVVAVAGCTTQAPTPTPTASATHAAIPAAQQMTTVHAASATAAIGNAGQLLAQTQGYFAQEALLIDEVKTDPSTTLPALLAGQIDVGGLGMDAGLFSAIQRGVDIRIVAPQASSDPDANGVFFVVRKDLIDGGRVRDYADLKGLKIAVSARGSSAEYVLARAMQAGGLTLSDANLSVMPFPAMVTALGSKAVDVGVISEPQATVAVENGTGAKWRAYADVVPGIQQTVVIFSPQFVAQREVATRWMTAYLRGIRDYNDAFVKSAHRQQTVDTLASALSIQPKLFER
jgi:NitT/TauT family transport system substrate-binding protein